MDHSDIKRRIEKDIALFNENIGSAKSNDKAYARIIEMARMYAQDSESYLDKGDFYTSFSCISYAHGLLDAVRKLAK